MQYHCCNEIYVEYNWYAVAKMEWLFTLLSKIYYYQTFLEICATAFINSENGKLPLLNVAVALKVPRGGIHKEKKSIG
jgi:hypothetical protein